VKDREITAQGRESRGRKWSTQKTREIIKKMKSRDALLWGQFRGKTEKKGTPVLCELEKKVARARQRSEEIVLLIGRGTLLRSGKKNGS